jgi:hypothetical protein
VAVAFAALHEKTMLILESEDIAGRIHSLISPAGCGAVGHCCGSLVRDHLCHATHYNSAFIPQQPLCNAYECLNVNDHVKCPADALMLFQIGLARSQLVQADSLQLQQLRMHQHSAKSILKSST